jgi:hypothetical protein
MLSYQDWVKDHAEYLNYPQELMELLWSSAQASMIPNDVNCPIDLIVQAYHRAMPENPRCRIVTAARKSAIRARWREAAKLKDVGPFGYDTPEQGVRAWGKFFQICEQSDFLAGRTTSSDGRPPFIADIDFLMSPSGFVKILENKYHR